MISACIVLIGSSISQPRTCSSPTASTCFGKGDEIAKFPNITTAAACCARCSCFTHPKTCTVWTIRNDSPDLSSKPTGGCHLRSSWQKSKPVAGSCTTGVTSGPLPPFPPGPGPAPAPPTGPFAIAVDASRHGRKIPKKMMGCHTDLGYDHQIYGIYTQLVYGESFEEYPANITQRTTNNQDETISPIAKTYWTPLLNTSTPATLALNTQNPLNGDVSLTITSATTARNGVANRGFMSQGLFIESGKGDYEGHFFARNNDLTTMTVAVALEDYFATKDKKAAAAATSYVDVTVEQFLSGDEAYIASTESKTLATTTLSIPHTGGKWQRVNFTLTPRVGTECRDFPSNTPPINCKTQTHYSANVAHSCVQCGGQLAIYLIGAGAIDLDYVVFSPGAWSRYKGADLPFSKRAAEALLAAGYTSIRTGGTYVKSDEEFDDPTTNGFLWKRMRGPRELRQPLRTFGTGGKQSGFPTTAGWSLIEAATQAELLNVDSVLTVHNSETLGDLGDLVDYLFVENDEEEDGMTSNSSSSGNKWAQLRAADGHPSPFDPTRVTFEIGNEIETPNWSERATAMENRAKTNNIGGILKYAAPDQTIHQFLNISDPLLTALGSQAMIDIHWGATCSSKGLSQESGQKYSAQLDAVKSKARLVVYETNTRCHDFTRVLCEATDLNDLHRSGMSAGTSQSSFRVDQRMQSFCMEMSGHDEALTKPGFRGDQGSTFVLPNMTYNQPPYFVHTMITKSWQDYAANATAMGVDPASASPLNVFATMDEKGDHVTLRVVNSADVAVSASVQLKSGSSAGAAMTSTTVVITTLAAGGVGISADNPAYDPLRYSPKTKAATTFENKTSFTFGAFSFTTLEFEVTTILQ